MAFPGQRWAFCLFWAAFSYTNPMCAHAEPPLQHDHFKSDDHEVSAPLRAQNSVAHVNNGLNQLAMGLALGKSPEGVRVMKVFMGSPAQAAGVKVGEVVVRVDGDEVQDPSDVVRLVNTHTVGDVLALTVTSDRTYSVRVATNLDILEARYPGLYSQVNRAWRFQTKPVMFCGMELRTAERSEIDGLSPAAQGGIVLTPRDPDNDPCALNGLQSGDVIVLVGDYRILDVLDFTVHLLGSLQEKLNVTLVSVRQHQTPDGTANELWTTLSIRGTEKLRLEAERIYATFQEEPD